MTENRSALEALFAEVNCFTVFFGEKNPLPVCIVQELSLSLLTPLIPFSESE